ncbi:hypothetical protein P280DRAFT_426795 [Massarina eburnea CBS 473.64]|uniref:Protein EFR3 n=1 Tax=Massarina eburnea CBS 473.64 TaxID=1395130 RepID=A0A6A6RZA8_9PLEO|nr:hypothetical protein P280DRAFT_426795 [Massarina eburnea CBS 473.64]
MSSVRQKCRPKHQQLVLKCYPRSQKNNVEVKANSSELLYLLYYASTRRSKLQKVGDFLDKRMKVDVWKLRIGNVQVTLEILKALIEKCPRDLPLFAASVLESLRAILMSSNIAMVEASVPAFEALCANQDPANLAADQDYIKQYEEVVQLYAHFASRDVASSGKTPMSWPVAIRYRKSGLRALNAIASSESLGSETGRQMAAIIPVILNSLFSETGQHLRRLADRENNQEEHEKEEGVRRRQSVSTAPPDEAEGDPGAATGTTEEADKLAEEEVGVLALQALRHIFMGVNRGHIRLATSAVLTFIGNHAKPQENASEMGISDWATTLMQMICGWASVQDRYMIMVFAVETLVRSPIVEEDLERQLVLANVIDNLLSSSINFIGLSVMDVLVGLISHTLLLLQLGGPGTAIMPHHQQNTSVISEKASDPSSGNLGGVVMELVSGASKFRVQLLDTVKKCMASLATHVYYTDQISDMVAAILNRLKPSPASDISNTAEAIEDPAGAVNAIASSASLQERLQHADRFFSFETARLTALETVKNIIQTANSRRHDGSAASVSRGPVRARAWEGTQWLLRDPSGQVRKAYVDALLTWLTLEKKREDLKLADEYRRKEKENDKGGLARRAVSNASHREKSPKRVKNTFLALLHLAVYENALQYVDSEADILLLHLLLTTLVNKLGVNAVRSGLPMVMRLQEDISTIESPGSKVRIGSLVHGYLWAVSTAMDFDTTSVGRTIHAEISRRNNKGLWVKEIRVPPMPFDRIETPHNNPPKLPADVVQTEALNPFDLREALIDRIADGYASSLNSPPVSPPSSPGRSMSIAMTSPSSLNTIPQLPFKVKEELLADWSRDLCLASNIEDPSAASVTGSRTAASGVQKSTYLNVTIPNGNLDSANNSPAPSPRRAHSRSRAPSTAYGLVGRISSPHRARSPSGTPGSASSVHSAVRVEDLKRVLSGSAPRTSYSIRPPTHRHHGSTAESSGSDSMVSVHSLTDASFMTTDPISPQDASTNPPATAASRPRSQSQASTTSPVSPKSANASFARSRAYSGAASDAPPVPPIPSILRDKSASPPESGSPGLGFNANGGSGSGFDRPKTAPNGKARSVRTGSKGARSVRDRSESRGRSGTGSSPDFSGFLDSIDVGEDADAEEEEMVRPVSRAPY